MFVTSVPTSRLLLFLHRFVCLVFRCPLVSSTSLLPRRQAILRFVILHLQMRTAPALWAGCWISTWNAGRLPTIPRAELPLFPHECAASPTSWSMWSPVRQHLQWWPSPNPVSTGDSKRSSTPLMSFQILLLTPPHAHMPSLSIFCLLPRLGTSQHVGKGL